MLKKWLITVGCLWMMSLMPMSSFAEDPPGTFLGAQVGVMSFGDNVVPLEMTLTALVERIDFTLQNDLVSKEWRSVDANQWDYVIKRTDPETQSTVEDQLRFSTVADNDDIAITRIVSEGNTLAASSIWGYLHWVLEDKQNESL